jgi:hypothetical protein
MTFAAHHQTKKVYSPVVKEWMDLKKIFFITLFYYKSFIEKQICFFS